MLIPQNRHIAHLDLDAFFISVEQLRNPTLNGKPVLVGGSNNRGVVAACSYEARRFGIHSAMPMFQAKRLCPHAIVVKSDFEAYSKYSTMVTDIIRDSVPLVEKASIDEFYIDMTGMDKFFGCRKFTEELKEKISKESGLPISYGLASNKLISKVATNEAKPKAQIEILFGNEKEFLAPLSVMKLPGVGTKVGYQLLKMGIETIRTLSRIPVEMLETLLGKNGTELWRRAQGIDETPVIPYREQKSISTERTYQQDTIDVAFLKSELFRMTERIAFDLRKQNRLTGCVTVKIRYSDFETHDVQKSIPYTNADHDLFAAASALFTKLYQRRQLIRLIGIRFTHLIPGTYQIDLFEDRQETIQLYQSIDSIKTQFGGDAVVRARSLFSKPPFKPTH